MRDYATTVLFPADQACLGLADFVTNEPAAAADRLLDHEADFVAIGGSRAQLEVLNDTLIAALARGVARTTRVGDSKRDSPHALRSATTAGSAPS